jgi:glycosyltransferase involved in cell wall biosynthesis
VREGDAHELAHQAEVLLSDHGLQERMGRAARAEAEKYSWQQIAAQIEDLFLQLVSK